MRPLCAGSAVGFALSLARAPLGIDLAQTPAVSPGEALAWRGCALAAAALAIGRYGGDRPRLGALALGAALGFGLHGLALADFVYPTSRLEVVAALLLLILLVRALKPRASETSAPEPAAGSKERLGLLVSGAGAAVALDQVARALRLLGGASPADEAVFGSTFLALLAFGAVAFGPLVPRNLRGGAAGALLALGALACVESIRTLGSFAARDALNEFLRREPWELDVSDIGRLRADLLLGARALLLPAFALGAALFVSGRGTRLAWILLGAALGHFLLPPVLQQTSSADPGLAPAIRVVAGVGLAGAGGALACALASATSRAGRAFGTATCAVAVAIAVIGLRAVGVPLSPWERLQVAPVLTLDAPVGLLTIEPTLDFGHVATLDRQRLTPAPVGEAADAQRLRLAWSRVDAAALAAPERRVLLVGQLTPERARTLLALGATHVDRTGAWHAQMEELEERLFEGAERPPGRILALGELGGAGPWVLAVAPPVQGAAPLVRDGEQVGTPRVVWIAARSPCSHLDWGERVLLSSDGIDDVSIAPRQPEGYLAGDPARTSAPWRRLDQRPFEREAASVAAALARIAGASVGTPSAELTQGLARLAAVQVRSSPFETEAQRVEIDVEALRLLREAALAAPPDLYLRDLWSALAALLADKRLIEYVDQYVAPIAERWQPWWQLEVALARTELESLDPEAAAEHLLRAAQERPLDLELRLACAEALSMAGNPRAAAQHLRAVEEVQPGRRDVRRRLAMELARAGDPAAAPLIDELLREDPEDEELRAFQGTGPFPAPPVQFSPHGGEHEHGD